MTRATSQSQEQQRPANSGLSTAAADYNNGKGTPGTTPVEPRQAPGKTAASRDDSAGLRAQEGNILPSAEMNEHPQDEAGELNELERLRAENADLRRALAELEQMLAQGSSPDEAAWMQRQQEYETLLEEKSEVIRSLHQKFQEVQGRPPAAGTPGEDELIALSEALEQERRQLQDDEENLQKQMREMEVQMSKERAELARQRHELQGLHGDIERELEIASRDAKLRERLIPLQRRHQEITNRKSSPTPVPQEITAPAPAAAEPPPPPKRAKDSSIFRRFFGGDK